ncbi:MAG: pilus assembly protein N-terminal domain-containing protein [Bryobacteraceae bacterium]|jgi:pilus assembly protein CpaC
MAPKRTLTISAAVMLIACASAIRLPAQGSAEDLRLTVGKSVVIDYPVDVTRISTSNPDVVDASPVTSREILLQGKSSGIATLVVWSKTGQRNFYNITIEQNLDPLRRLLAETFPNAEIHVQSSRDSLSMTGRVPSKDVADRAMALAAPFAKQIVSNLQVDTQPVEKQIVLRVRFASLDRSVSNQFAVNLVSTGAANTIGRTTTGQAAAPQASSIGAANSGSSGGSGSTGTFSLSDALNIFAFRPDLNLAAVISALQAKGVLQILAEPNLVTTNGKEASFLAGGEFPVPVIQGGANSGAVTVQFREYGIRLSFTPELTENHTIRMHVKPEVSTLDTAHSVTISGFSIPALATRRIETNIELGAQQSFVIAGLIDNEVNEQFSRIPGLASLPVLGSLFKSRIETKSRSELIVLVTPEITTPIQSGQPLPLPMMPREFLGPAAPQQVEPMHGANSGRSKSLGSNKAVAASGGN